MLKDMPTVSPELLSDLKDVFSGGKLWEFTSEEHGEELETLVEYFGPDTTIGDMLKMMGE